MMKETELKPCPFCGGNDLTIKDNTDMVYGFDGYEIRCRCGCRFASGSVHEHYWQGKKYCTPITENSKKIAYDKMIEDWNRRSDNEKDKRQNNRTLHSLDNNIANRCYLVYASIGRNTYE